MAEQRNPYRRNRPWLRLGFKLPDGSIQEHDLLADTGSAASVILRPDLLLSLRHEPSVERESNFGAMICGWLRLYSPELGLVEFIRGYGSEKAYALASRNNPELAGLVGLPVLRMLEYGGNHDSFWIRTPT